MTHTYLVKAWSRILLGYQPVLSIEITNHCPLSCPGCYAYQPNHVGGTALEQIGEFAGRGLVEGILGLVDQRRPLLVYVVGGEPLVRYRELSSGGRGPPTHPRRDLEGPPDDQAFWLQQ